MDLKDREILTELLLEQSEYLNHISTHTNRFNIVLSKLGDFMVKIVIHPPELAEELQSILEQLGETSILIGQDFTELGINGQTFIKTLQEIIKK